MVVNFPIVDEPDVGVGVESDGLHAPDVIHDWEAVKAQTAVLSKSTK